MGEGVLKARICRNASLKQNPTVWLESKQIWHKILTSCVLYIKIQLNKGCMSLTVGKSRPLTATVMSGQIAALTSDSYK